MNDENNTPKIRYRLGRRVFRFVGGKHFFWIFPSFFFHPYRVVYYRRLLFRFAFCGAGKTVVKNFVIFFSLIGSDDDIGSAGIKNAV